MPRCATHVRCRHSLKTCLVTGLKSKSSLESLLSKSKSSRKSSLIMSSQVTSPQIWDSSPSQVSSHATPLWILTRTRKSEHITPVLRSLHWLPVTFRIDFKVLLLIYKSLNGLGPKYIADMLTEYKPNRPLRSLGSSQLEIPRVHTKQGESAFSYYAAHSWNQLPEEIRCAKTLVI